jgi:hypothetical protein
LQRHHPDCGQNSPALAELRLRRILRRATGRRRAALAKADARRDGFPQLEQSIFMQAGFDRFSTRAFAHPGLELQGKIRLQQIVLGARRVPGKTIGSSEIEFTRAHQYFFALDTIDRALTFTQLIHA